MLECCFSVLHLLLLFAEAMLNHTSPTVLVAACHCIGQIGRNNDLPIPTRNLKHSVKYGEFDGLPTEHDAGLSSGEAVEKFGSITKHRLVERLLHLTVEKDVPYKVSFYLSHILTSRGENFYFIIQNAICLIKNLE